MLKFSVRFFPVRSTLFVLAGSMALFPIAGCGPSENVKKDRKAVNGTVKFQDAPLLMGLIRFTPSDDSKATTQQEADVRKGKYEIPGKTGLEPGKYRVVIYSTDPKAPNPGEKPRSSDEKAEHRQLPPQYNDQTELECEVKPRGQNTFDFDLK